jgi:glycosyltransferase involved in cell wall biosynthesis
VKLGFILEPEAANSLYRVIFPMRALERRGHSVLWPANLQRDLPLAGLLDCDLVHCFRRPDRAADLKRLAARGVAISVDNDDDLSATDVSSTSPNRSVRGARGRLENVKKFSDLLMLARHADLVTTPSPVLAGKYSDAGAQHVRVIENYLDEGWMHGYGQRTKHAGVVVGWVAAKEHERDLQEVSIVDAISRLLNRYSQLRVITIGSRLPLQSPRYEFRREVPFVDLTRVAGELDIGIAPIADTAFNRSRSNVKLKEYAAGGAAWLASNVGPYRGLGGRQGGHLVEGDRWFDALDSLISSPFARRRLSRRALRWARGQTIDSNAAVWEDAFEDAITRAHTRP